MKEEVLTKAKELSPKPATFQAKGKELFQNNFYNWRCHFLCGSMV
jgi:hypothetical protein